MTKNRFKVLLKRHLRKLDKIRKRKAVIGNRMKPSMHIKHTVHNFTSYVLSDEVYKALSYSLDHHIPTSSNHSTVETEFELFYQNILSNISHIAKNEFTQLKSKLRNVCHKYSSLQIAAYYCKPHK